VTIHKLSSSQRAVLTAAATGVARYRYGQTAASGEACFSYAPHDWFSFTRATMDSLVRRGFMVAERVPWGYNLEVTPSGRSHLGLGLESKKDDHDSSP
jgi:hypothetical protein